jgi:hypothetical protein
MKFTVTMEIDVERSSSVLSTDTYRHTDDVKDAIADIMYDLDDVKVIDITVNKMQQR